MFWSIKKSVPKVLFWNKSRKKTMQFMHKKAIKMEKRKNGKEKENIYSLLPSIHIIQSIM